ncbi:MAG: type II secretion system protein [Planctomycetota bacterium]
MVIAIISILAGLLLPALESALESGRSVMCMNNLKQYGLSYNLYMDDHDGWLSGSVDGSSSGMIMSHIENVKRLGYLPYTPVGDGVGGVGAQGMHVCPSEPHNYTYNYHYRNNLFPNHNFIGDSSSITNTPSTSGKVWAGSNYGLNQNLFVLEGHDFARQAPWTKTACLYGTSKYLHSRPQNVPRPSRFVFIGEKSYGFTTRNDFLTCYINTVGVNYGMNWWPHVIMYSSWGEGGWLRMVHSEQLKTNVNFMDGSVSSLTFEEVRALDDSVSWRGLRP